MLGANVNRTVGDLRKFEMWRQSQSKAHTITLLTVEVKRQWLDIVKRFLLSRLKELEGERVR